MSAPGDREQLDFLTKLQRLLAEGNFVASYKYALLLSLADIAVEKGDDSGAPMQLSLDDIAEKFIKLYWRQAVPHPAGAVLRQNTGGTASIVTAVGEARKGNASLATVACDARAWSSLKAKVRQTVKTMPLLKLQTLGATTIEFLYANTVVDGGITLKPGVAFCLRRFHGLIEDLVRGAWLRYVRRTNQNLIGEAADLSEFMFGSEREDLGAYVPILRDLQMDACFYCGKRLSKPEIDHFIPWSLYPVDLGHNFVLADEGCNGKKSDVLAGTRHLARWWRQVDDHGAALASEFDNAGKVHDAAASQRVTTWAYANAEQAGALLWVEAKKFEKSAGWRAAVGGQDCDSSYPPEIRSAFEAPRRTNET